jgi:hypothetical protein
MRLQAVNRFEPLFAHLTTTQGLHPEMFYQIAVQMAGEMATFTDKVKRRPPPFPAYDHDDLQKTFAPVMQELRRSLSLEEVDAAIQIPLEERQFGIRVGIITDREKPLLTKANFILAVRADLAADVVRILDPFRAPLTAAEVARRRPERLTARQRDLLAAYGYPFVMEEFQFHLTLSGRLKPEDAPRLHAAAKAHFAGLIPQPFDLQDLCLCGEDQAGRFHLLHRYALSA